jgi:uncharacterized membrane protein YeaQ/YmgE (transglycosylase-associated protein family)
VADGKDDLETPKDGPPPGDTPGGKPAGVIDLKTVGPSPAAAGASAAATAAATSAAASNMGSATAVTPYTLDGTRQRIAFILLGILGAIVLVEVIASAVFASNCWFFETTKGSCPQAQASLSVLTSAMGTIFTAMVGLVGSVVGFYFGSQKQN